MKKDSIDILKLDKRATELARDMSASMARPGLSSMTESLMVCIAGVCKFIQMISMILGVEPKELSETFVKGIEDYFKKGGDPVITSVGEVLKEKGN